MFSASAELYDLVYFSFKDYAAETVRLAELLHRLHPDARTVLDIACGTGEHARRLTESHGLIVDGLDLDPAFVNIARRKLPDASVFHADMSTFELGRKYDVILCLFSSIGYVRTLDKVTETLTRFAAHLAPNGIVIVEPWFPPGVLTQGRTHAMSANTDGVSICRMSRMEVDDRVSRVYFEYLIGRSQGIEHVAELHELGLFTTDEMQECFRSAGLQAEHDPVGLCDRGLFVGRATAPLDLREQ